MSEYDEDDSGADDFEDYESLRADVDELMSQVDSLQDSDIISDDPDWHPQDTASTTYQALYDIYDSNASSDSTTIKIRGSGVGEDFLALGDPVEVDGIDTNITISADTYIWIEHDLDTAIVTLKNGASITTPTATLNVFPLWYIPWDSTKSVIDTNNIMDLRPVDMDWPASIPPGTSDGQILVWDQSNTQSWIKLAAPSVSSFLAFDPNLTGADAVCWVPFNNPYMVAQEGVSDSPVGDWVRFH